MVIFRPKNDYNNKKMVIELKTKQSKTKKNWKTHKKIITKTHIVDHDSWCERIVSNSQMFVEFAGLAHCVFFGCSVYFRSIVFINIFYCCLFYFMTQVLILFIIRFHFHMIITPELPPLDCEVISLLNRESRLAITR